MCATLIGAGIKNDVASKFLTTAVQARTDKLAKQISKGVFAAATTTAITLHRA